MLTAVSRKHNLINLISIKVPNVLCLTCRHKIKIINVSVDEISCLNEYLEKHYPMCQNKLKKIVFSVDLSIKL